MLSALKLNCHAQHASIVLTLEGKKWLGIGLE